MRNALPLLMVIAGIIIASPVFANEDKQLDRLDGVNEALQKPLLSEERADLLLEKSRLMFDLFGELYLRTATEALLKTIALEPEKKESREYLAEVYDRFWADRDFSGDDQVSKDLAQLKERCKNLLKR
jgi:predicted polyphosphate/ATP-dependent NAD kinase